MRYHTLIVALCLAGTALAGTPQQLTLDVQNMTCATCPITVKKALQQVPGVSEVRIDFAAKTATVQVDPDKAQPVALTKATADAGFPSTVRK